MSSEEEESIFEEEEDFEDNIDTGAEMTDIGNILKVNKIQKDTKADMEIQIETKKISKWASIRYKPKSITFVSSCNSKNTSFDIKVKTTFLASCIYVSIH